MTVERRMSFELVLAPDGEPQALRLPAASLNPEGAPIPQHIAALISRLGLAEACLVEDRALIFCREDVAASPRSRAAIPRGVPLFFFAHA